MRLRKLKVAGFKSFVDPTTVQLPSELIGIVGPNGCGKSNIIDAVRWVMGETSAKQLRGDSMADVVFNGSNTRKPVGQASVELVFDNSDGKLGGQWANYNEIAIKRTVSRDGQSNYYLNGVRCRRRDITDIFLGTGLGPRSYAIIEQGTISRIIEAKPEELRIFMEEAAGISKYKERRKETETRIRHTRDNLDRLNDLREELEKQINHLQRQAKAAERYKILKEEERLVSAQLQALRWKALNENAASVESAIRDKETALEAARAQQRSIEAEIEKQREALVEANETFNKIQSRFYSVGSDIARIEQSIQHTRERRQQQQNDLAQLEKDLNEAQSHLSTDQQRIAQLRQELETIGPSLEQTQAAERDATTALQQAEQSMQTWQQEWEQFTQQAAEPARAVEVESARIQQLEQQLLQLEQRKARLGEELEKQRNSELETELQGLQSQLDEQTQQLSQKQTELQNAQAEIGQTREALQQYSAHYEQQQESLQGLRARHASLTALQQAALGKQQEGVKAWLQNQHLEEAKRLAEILDVEKGWERAVECVLGANLEAVCVDSLDDLFTNVMAFDKGQLTLLEKINPADNVYDKAPTLLSKVHSAGAVPVQIEGVYAVETLAEALALRTRLQRNESVVTREGIWLGLGWLRVTKLDETHSGVLQREQEIKTLNQSISEQGDALQHLQQERQTTQEKLKQLEQLRDGVQSALQVLNRQHNELNGRTSALRARYEQTQARIEQLQHEFNEVVSHGDKTRETIAEARGRREQAQDLIGGHAKRKEELTQQREELQQSLSQSRTSAQSARESAQEVRLRAETMRTELNSTQQALQRIDNQQAQLQERREELQTAIKEAEQPLQEMKDELAALLKTRVEVENELSTARNSLQSIDQTHRELEEQRGKAEEGVQAVRGELEEVRIGWQEIKVRRQTVQEAVTTAGFEVTTLINELPQDASEPAWAENLDAIEKRIQRLGAINLAAIEEFEQQSERKKYLDEQNADLMEALKTLEDAIAKIDKETKERFNETFEKVNNGVKELFPRLFGGGHAYLEMTSDDILETGITVMARPPGKRNSTIHLLSGGEKALTAVALVFSIFQLNPAPFCMLDEVDAPLDDANVGRFCDMLKHMSDRVQFIFITHNKITMEIADHLTGVTMHEPGVSRLVAVDVDEAVKLAAV
ncbi:MAG: chromosome segregation protein SMC [Gammaproteobacteria bacterium]|nr:chromosome segregation protein SMC [Gammaproteobacteria bacterium]